MSVPKSKQGFSLIELLFVLVIIAIIASVAIPAYIGIRNRAYEASIFSAARSSTDTLSFWLYSSVSPRDTTEVDTNFDGRIDSGDKSNSQLLADGVASTFVRNRNLLLNEKSPWDPGISLWSTDSALPSGQITLQQLSDYKIKMSVKNMRGSVIHEKIITAD